MKRNIYYLFFILPLLLGCSENKGSDSKSNDDQVDKESNSYIVGKGQFESNIMSLGTIQEKSFPNMVQSTGMIDVPPQNRAVVSTFMGGYINETPLLIGDVVKKGQPLFTIENPEFVTLQQSFLEVSSKLDYLKSEYERQKILMAENVSSEKRYLKAESEYKTARARQKGFEKQLLMLNISPSKVKEGVIVSAISVYAPIRGSITKMNVSKGMYVSQATEIIEIINNEHIHLELSIFEKDIMKIKKGDTIQFTIPEISTKIFIADVFLIGSSIDNNRTIKVHGHIEDESKNNFLTGMFVEASIITDSTLSGSLPEEAIVELEGNYYILKLEETRANEYLFKRFPVDIGSTHNGFTQIKSDEGFETSDQFLVKGAFSLIEE
ncbi:efflux RND transporter periplasmic adaptor subunit [Spongiivirga citrea]|uniref:Efflux RND transporter periplasmic adaptor subunit n=1 Tax=Spongiivirga citrea TaxID=1481457 RepID=A0A6M0CSH8_9FLAO|nr:efflux RND transporter periplasmic adaptor subunit [Spongiivirga citrea]NER19044.1 efflux RND transporter periplasmic adaptor subunit [Spongiivirga citrea]